MTLRCLLSRLIIVGAVLGCESLGVAQDANFKRGDSNSDGKFDLSDPVRTLKFLFTGEFDLPCHDAADSNDSGKLDLADGTYSLDFLFRGGEEPPAPLGACGRDPTPDPLDCQSFDECPQQVDISEVGHVLNRVAYGRSPRDYELVEAIGVTAYLQQQLDPESVDESDNLDLISREDELFQEKLLSEETDLVRDGELWRYRKGTSEPPSSWKSLDFDDSGVDWLTGVTGIGYGDADDRTVLRDMQQIPGTQPGYASVYLRRVFTIDDISAVDMLIFRVSYDDSFVMYFNGVEILRRNVSGNPPRFNAFSSDGHEADVTDEIDLSGRINRLQDGDNVLAIQVHNRALDSSDLTMRPELVSRTELPGTEFFAIKGVDELQQLMHVRGVYSRRQLQTVLAEFWENHFTTDVEKVAEYFDSLQNSDASDALSSIQALEEALQLELREYQFFYDNALGNFADLFLFSATSPTMLIYLDNVLNSKVEPNENYAREAFELYAHGVDNRYRQRDIEQLARAITGWTVCKIAPADVQDFPASARTPVEDCGVSVDDTVLVNLGAAYRVFRGQREPSPGASGEATTAWTEPGFDTSGTGWFNGRTGIGYGDNDDRTVLNDMMNRYLSVYVRHEFNLEDPSAVENLILEMEYDDGFVAYVNGIEVARSESMLENGTPPAFDKDSEDHEIREGCSASGVGCDFARFNANIALGTLRLGTNVLAIQVHNTNIDSSDLSCLPRLIDREILPGSIENGARNAQWAFRFNTNEHDDGLKVLHQGTEFEIRVGAGTPYVGGDEASHLITQMANHPSTREFLCVKLIQKFVSDELTFARFKEDQESVPLELRILLADAIATWRDTNGSIEAVMRTILDPVNKESAFWSQLAYRSKVKTPIEFINSSIRVLDGVASGAELDSLNGAMGMRFFTRDEPDGWSELGFDWVDTATLLARIEFARALADDRTTVEYGWNTLAFLDERGLETAEEITGYFVDHLYDGAVAPSNRSQFVEFLTTSSTGEPLEFSVQRTDFRQRVQDLIALMLSAPMWQFQ